MRRGAPDGRRALLACRCGAVRGTLSDASPRAVNRVLCCCRDCQAFAHALGRPDLLDARGGSDIVQVAPARLAIGAGHERVAALRLTGKGLHRFHAACCGTPLGNTPGPAFPVIGIPKTAFEVEGQDPDALFGPPAGIVHADKAKGGALPGPKGVPLRILLRTLLRIVGWRLAGLGWPHPFFDRATEQPLFPVSALAPEAREAPQRQPEPPRA